MSARNIPSHNGPPVTAKAPPNQTLYLTNIPGKLRKRDVRLSLYTLCSTYGVVLDVVVMPKSKMRGQAWVAFRDVQASTQAMRSLQGFDFFGSQLSLQYAKGKSNTVAKLDGTYRVPAASTAAPVSTGLQQQIFANPASSLPVPSLPPKPALRADKSDENAKGVKRGREDESEEEDVAMDEDSDAPMEEGSDDDD